MLGRTVNTSVQQQRIILCKGPSNSGYTKDLSIDLGKPYVGSLRTHLKVKLPTIISGPGVNSRSKSRISQILESKCMAMGNSEQFDEDDEVCPVECVREFQTDEELFMILEKAKETNALVVVDFYRTSCGSCKYIEQGFAKLCKGSGDEGAPVIFLKHNVIDEYDEQSEVAERLRIKSVPLFHFYKDGILVEAFATRDKERINAAIAKYTRSAAQIL